jgi:hypothetical protein
LSPYMKAREDGKIFYCIGYSRIYLFAAFHAITFQNMAKGRLKGGLICHHARKK